MVDGRADDRARSSDPSAAVARLQVDEAVDIFRGNPDLFAADVFLQDGPRAAAAAADGPVAMDVDAAAAQDVPGSSATHAARPALQSRPPVF